jgi:hypothetical protein
MYFKYFRLCKCVEVGILVCLTNDLRGHVLWSFRTPTHAERIGATKNRASGAVVVVMGLGRNGLVGWFQYYRK